MDTLSVSFQTARKSLLNPRLYEATELVLQLPCFFDFNSLPKDNHTCLVEAYM